jgi:hypothetical protein
MSNKSNVAVDEFAIFAEMEQEKATILAQVVAKAEATVRAQRAAAQAEQAKELMAASTAEYQAEVAKDLKKAETKRLRANTKALHKANGTTPARIATSSGVKSRFGGHREATQGFTMDVAIGQFYDANHRIPDEKELSELLPQFEVGRLKGHLSFLKRTHKLPNIDA